MNDPLYQRASEVFQRIVKQPRAAWDGLLERECGSNAALRSYVVELLDGDRDDSFLVPQAGEPPDQTATDFADPGADRPPPSGEFGETLRRLRSRQGFARYELKGELDAGGMGAIQLVYDADLSRQLAMKVIHPERVRNRGGAFDSLMLGRFLDEAQVSAQLDHPGIVPIHELGVDPDDNVYFTMKLVKGENLAEIFEKVRRREDGWTQPRALNALLRVCEAMSYAHAKGVIHRDLKPANIMIGRHGEVFVMDWGLARIIGREDRHSRLLSPPPSTQVWSRRQEVAGYSPESPVLTDVGSVFGTPNYMPPEQAAGLVDEIGAASDVYSFGAVLYHLLAGTPPYREPGQSSDPVSTIQAVMEGPPAELAQVAADQPGELIAICEAAMKRKPADRYRSFDAIADDLRAFLENRMVSVYRTGPLIEARKWVRRNTGLAVAAGIAVLLAIGGSLLLALVTQWKNAEIGAINGELTSRNADLETARGELAQSVRNLEDTAEQLKESKEVAEASARQAEEARTRAEQAHEELRRRFDFALLRELLEREGDLWPRRSSTVFALERWVEEAGGLIHRLGKHQESLEALRARGSLKEEASGGQAWHFTTEDDRWHHENLTGLVEGIEELAGLDGGDGDGLLREVQARLALARSVRQETIERHRGAWDAVAADTIDSEIYGDLEIVPIEGLVPIGKDPTTQLWEFWHYESGAKPARDPLTGQLVVQDPTGMVLVLIPPGFVSLGSQAENVRAANFDRQSSDDERPLVDVELDAFLLSKYEMTQRQWERLVGANPSSYPYGELFERKVVTGHHPVDMVSWPDCESWLERADLRLPTEAQWEYAARAGSAGARWFEGLGGSPDQYANFADGYAEQNFGLSGWVFEPDTDDGFTFNAPVGSYEPNDFGLHDVLGNVWEWCRDPWVWYSDGTRAEGDGVLVPSAASTIVSDRVARGGGHNNALRNLRSARRARFAARQTAGFLGVRPSRSLDPVE